MTQLALVKGSVIATTVVEGTGFTLDDGSRVSPAYAGWKHGAYELFDIAAPDAIPEGQQEAARDVQLVGGVPKWVLTLEPVPPAPFLPLNPVQFQTVLEILGIESAVDAAIAKIADPHMRAYARAKFKRSLVYERDDPLFDSLAADPLVNMSSDDLDAAWRTAEAIT